MFVYDPWVSEFSQPPILTAHLFKPLDEMLLVLLESLESDEWRRPTIVPQWNVKQITAHLLDTALRRLSFVRDGEPSGPPPEGDLVRFVNDMNARGVEFLGRLSGPVLISLTRPTVRALHEYFASLPPMSPSPWPVSWAGETHSENWFDIAREFTERWHHQQQIRLAVDRPGIMTRELYGPVLECFMRALPHAYRHVHAPIGALCDVVITGESGGRWRIRKNEGGWAAVKPREPPVADHSVSIPEDIAWRIFTKGMSRDDARARISLRGDERVSAAVLEMVTIVG